jgi:hypothetical protein
MVMIMKITVFWDEMPYKDGGFLSEYAYSN